MLYTYRLSRFRLPLSPSHSYPFSTGCREMLPRNGRAGEGEEPPFSKPLFDSLNPVQMEARDPSLTILHKYAAVTRSPLPEYVTCRNASKGCKSQNLIK